MKGLSEGGSLRLILTARNNHASATDEPPEMAGWNLTLRFGLEVVSLIALGMWGFSLGMASSGGSWPSPCRLRLLRRGESSTYSTIPADPVRRRLRWPVSFDC